MFTGARLLIVLTFVALVSEGQATFVAQKCDTCHSVPQASLTATTKLEKMKGPDLPAAQRDVKWTTRWPSRAPGTN